LIESPKVVEVMPEHDAEQFLRRFVAILNAVNAKLYLSVSHSPLTFDLVRATCTKGMRHPDQEDKLFVNDQRVPDDHQAIY